MFTFIAVNFQAPQTRVRIQHSLFFIGVLNGFPEGFTIFWIQVTKNVALLEHSRDTTLQRNCLYLSKSSGLRLTHVSCLVLILLQCICAVNEFEYSHVTGFRGSDWLKDMCSALPKQIIFYGYIHYNYYY